MDNLNVINNLLSELMQGKIVIKSEGPEIINPTSLNIRAGKTIIQLLQQLYSTTPFVEEVNENQYELF